MQNVRWKSIYLVIISYSQKTNEPKFQIIQTEKIDYI